jgi:hypothetical protein
MLKHYALGAAFLYAPLLSAYDSLYIPQQQTVVRERRAEIHTVYQDVRSPMVNAMPGMALYDSMQLRVMSQYSNAWWSGLQEDQRDQGRSLNTEILARFNLNYFLLELETGAQDSDLTDIDIHNLDIRLAIPLYQARYTGITFVAGGSAALSSDGEVPGYNHESDISRWAYLSELRFTTNIGFNVLSLNFGGRWAPNVKNSFPDHLITDDGFAIPSGKGVENNYVGIVGRAGWSYRPLRYARAGVEYLLNYDNFEFENPDPTEPSADLSNINHYGQFFIEANPIRELAITAFLGVNIERWTDLDHDSALVIGGSLQTTF